MQERKVILEINVQITRLHETEPRGKRKHKTKYKEGGKKKKPTQLHNTNSIHVTEIRLQQN